MIHSAADGRVKVGRVLVRIHFNSVELLLSPSDNASKSLGRKPHRQRVKSRPEVVPVVVSDESQVLLYSTKEYLWSTSTPDAFYTSSRSPLSAPAAAHQPHRIAEQLRQQHRATPRTFRKLGRRAIARYPHHALRPLFLLAICTSPRLHGFSIAFDDASRPRIALLLQPYITRAAPVPRCIPTSTKSTTTTNSTGLGGSNVTALPPRTARPATTRARPDSGARPTPTRRTLPPSRAH